MAASYECEANASDARHGVRGDSLPPPLHLQREETKRENLEYSSGEQGEMGIADQLLH